jgi:ubiquinone/menaquinone biosynthesis C-methylase UbiE
VSEHTHGAIIRDRYRPAEFDAERYSPDNLSFWTPIIVRLGRVQHDHEVLDLGCATGGLTCAVAESSGAHLVGCDLSRTLLDYGRRVRGRTSIPMVCSNGEHLPFGRRYFDCVIASLVLHQVRDRQRVLVEISRALRPAGLLLIRTVTPETAKRWIPDLFPSIAQAQAARMPSIPELTDALTRAGFSEIETTTIVREKRLQPEQVERSLRRDIADRYPFLDDDELARGLKRMREHWTTRRDDYVDERTFSILTASKRHGPQ